MSNYSSRIIEHFTDPRNMGEMPLADLGAEVRNPVCGDQIRLFARVRDERIAACTFLAYGCAAAIGTASILTEAIQGRTIEELAAVQASDVIEMVGGLSPSQRHCAQLAREVLMSLALSYRNGYDLKTSGSVSS
jgi:nitrogen fixation NifU-like protein